MRGINLCFDYEADEMQTRTCYPEKIIELSYDEFVALRKNPHDDFNFISDNRHLMDDSNGDVYYGILYTTNNSEDGIFVMETPFKREVAYVPYAQVYLEREQYPSLADYSRRMVKTANEQLAKALNNQEEGKYNIRIQSLNKGDKNLNIDEKLFLDMMNDREEIEYAESGWDDANDVVYLGIAHDYVKLEDDAGLRPISKTDFDIVYANHTLWLNNAGGKQADLSNCLIRGIDLSGKDLRDAIFNGAKFVDCTISGTDMSNGSFIGTRFTNCEIFTWDASSSDFTNARFSLLDVSGCRFELSNFTNAVFNGCGMVNVNLDNCCMEGADLTDSTLAGTNLDDTFDDEQEWSNHFNGLGEQS